MTVPATPRLRVLLALTLVVPALAAVATPAPARAATTYTWTGASSTSWHEAANWSPAGVPGTDDSVVVVGPVARNITDVPTLTLTSLTVGSPTTSGLVVGGPGTLTVDELDWTGGTIDVDLVVAAPSGTDASVISPSGSPLRFGGGTRTLTVSSAVDVLPGAAAGTGPWVQLMFDSNVRVTPSGTLGLDGGAYLLANRCCTDPTSTITVDGRLDVTGTTGQTTRLEQLGLDHAGGVDVDPGVTLRLVGGPVRVGSNAVNQTSGGVVLQGGGVLEVAETDGGNFRPDAPLAPDGTMKFLSPGGVLVLSQGTTLRLGPSATTSGTGRLAGEGRLQLAGAALRGRLTLDPGVTASTVAGTTSRLAAWDPAVAGQHGALYLRGGPLTVVPTSTLRVDSRTRLTVLDGGQLTVQGGASLSAGGCCTSPGQVVLDPGGRLRVGGGSSAPAEVKWFALSGSGEVLHAGPTTWDLPVSTLTADARITGTGTITGDYAVGAASVMPVGVLTVKGDYRGSGAYRPTLPASGSGTVAPSRLVVTGEARLGGRLLARGATRFAPGHRVVVLQAGRISGGFACSVVPGVVLSSTTTTVGLRGIAVGTPACTYPAPARLLSATFKGRKAASLRLSPAARQVIVEVTVSKASGSTRLGVSAGRGTRTVQVRRGKTVSRTLLLPVGPARRLELRLGKRARVVVTRVAWTA
ncbi:hypothetical protein ABFT23_19750 [Nocardioides sp. C4-1]|uniref:hypothetical protein n=1 Tax=Nocardioides sp. C4-1 TaxID=3151851 RepID=UPI0032665454